MNVTQNSLSSEDWYLHTFGWIAPKSTIRNIYEMIDWYCSRAVYGERFAAPIAINLSRENWRETVSLFLMPQMKIRETRCQKLFSADERPLLCMHVACIIERIMSTTRSLERLSTPLLHTDSKKPLELSIQNEWSPFHALRVSRVVPCYQWIRKRILLPICISKVLYRTVQRGRFIVVR